jgi:hypothetical protein
MCEVHRCCTGAVAVVVVAAAAVEAVGIDWVVVIGLIWPERRCRICF